MLKDRAVHYMVRWQQGPRQKNSVHRPGATQAASNESISLRRLAGVARGPLCRGARLEAIGPID